MDRTPPRRLATPALLALSVASLAAPAAGQQVEGIVHTRVGGPVSGVAVHLLRPNLTTVDSTLTDHLGRFGMALPDTGAYVVVVQGRGIAAKPEVFRAPDGGAIHLLIGVEELPGFAASVRRVAPSERVDLVGNVSDRQTGRPIENAQVELTGKGVRALTSRGGRFVMLDQESGTAVITTSHLGYEERADTIHLPAGWATEVALQLDVAAIPLDGIDVSVTSRAAVRRLQPVYERIDRGMGGSYMLAEDLERYGYPSIAEAIARLPSVKLERAFGSLYTVAIRGGVAGCSPALFVDGVLAIRPKDPPDFLWKLQTMDVEIIEVYPGPSTLPGELAYSGVECAVAVWTRRGGGQ